MGSGKGAGQGAKSYDYYGTLAGAICWGPVDSVLAVIIDGKNIISGPVTLSADATNLSLASGSEKYLLPAGDGGRLTIYNGTSTQNADTALTGTAPPHGAYRGICYLVAVGLLFGRERTMAPNVQVTVRRKPVADTSLVASGDNTVDAQGQCNPVASLVELLTSPHGLSIPVASMDASAWLAAAAWAKDSARSAYTYCSPCFTSQGDARRTIAELLTMIDATLYWTPAGKLSIALLEPGVTPVSPITIDARHITARHRLDAPGWLEVPTSTSIRYPDRTHSYKERVVKTDNLLALQRRGGVPMISNVERKHITGADQATKHAVEASRRAAQPIGDIDLKVRRPIAEALYPGAKILVDVDPEPGGSALAQLCVVQEVRTPPVGEIGLRLRPDTLVESTPYSPVWSEPTPQAAECPPIDEDKAVAVPLPTKAWPTPSVAILAPRPRADVIGFRVFFSSDDTDYADLGTQPGFSLRAAIDADITEEDTEVILTLPETDTGPDAYLAERFPETQIGAAGDELLLFIANIDANGRVIISDGAPEMEICSIVTRSLVGSDMTYEILRARHGSSNRAWTTTAKCWIVPGESVAPWTHQAIQGLVQSGAIGYFRLVAYTVEAEDESTPVPQISFVMPGAYNLAPIIVWTAPATSTGTTDGSGDIAIDLDVTDGDGDLVSIKLAVVQQSDGRITNFPEITLGGVGAYNVTRTLKGLAVGTHELIVTATDRKHSPVQSKRTLYRASGGSITPPDFDPPPQSDPWWFTSIPFNLEVEVTCVAPADRIEWNVLPRGSAQPASGVLEMSTSKTFTLYTDKRIWARCGDGSSWSAWVSADYDLELGVPP